MSTSIISDISNNESFVEYWMPLMYKHPEIEFIFTKCTGMKCPKNTLKNYKYSFITRNDAVKSARNESVFLTEEYALPTYETMVLLASLHKDNVCVNPSWQETGERTESFSILKNQFIDTNLDRDQYIQKFNPKVVDTTTVYSTSISI